jgi:hypothetical protein
MSRPAVTRSRLYQFSPRGIFEVDKSSGDVVRTFRGADLGSLGGSLFVTPKMLVTVSNVAVTAYALDRDLATARPHSQIAGGEESAGNP